MAAGPPPRPACAAAWAAPPVPNLDRLLARLRGYAWEVDGELVLGWRARDLVAGLAVGNAEVQGLQLRSDCGAPFSAFVQAGVYD